jgi:tetratricopeptide (TPR) repeat protein
MAPPAPALSLDAALHHLHKGAFAEAARVCEALLAADPRNATALHLLGTVRTQQRDLPAALDLFTRAIDADPAPAACWFSQGTALKELGRYEAALASLDEAVRRDPSHALAHCVRGDVLSALGRPAEALAAFDRALALNPNLIDAHNNRGNELRALGRHTEALAAYDIVLSRAPRHAAAIVNRGNAFIELGRFEEALAAYDQALSLLPNMPQIHVRRGDALQSLDRFSDALAAHECALAIAPDLVQGLTGRATALKWLGRLEEAEAAAHSAIAVNCDYAPAHNTLGNVLRDLGRFEQAIASFRRAVELAPAIAEIETNLGQALLLSGDFGPEAWRAHEYRLGLTTQRIVTPPRVAPHWQGEPIAGKRILVYAEQGLGDTLHFFRLLEPLRRRGAKVALLTQPQLAKLLAPSAGDIEIVTTPPNTGVDYIVALLSLPLHLGITLDTIPADIPYMSADPERTAAWRDKLGAGFKVGIAWQGSSASRIDIGRSFPLSAFAPLGPVPGVRLISLQKGAGSEQLDAAPAGLAVERLSQFDEGPDAFLDTAAVMQNLDLVVTSDTAIAHLAGALGRPVWVALQHIPDWRWLMQRPDSPWYPTMRLFRQPARGDWASVFDAIAAALADLVRASQSKRPAPSVPVSWGELFDKVSILEIKSERLTASSQRANVDRELSALAPATAEIADAPAELAALRADLKSVNTRLWEIEDAIRAKEAAQTFDTEFVELARSVYRTNDERGRIKRRINELLGSTLLEEKQYHAYGAETAKAPR